MANEKKDFLEGKKQEKKYIKSENFILILAIVLIGIGAGLGIYYGINTNHSEITKIVLSNLNTDTITGIENMTEDDAFNDFIANQSKDTSDLRANVDLSFVAPDYVKTGSLIITAKANTKYTGSITITINAIGQTDINELGLTIDLDSSYTDKDQAFEAFLSANSIISDLKDNIEPRIFTPSGYGIKGSLEIKTKANHKYTGTIIVNFKKLVTTSLSTLNKEAIKGTKNMTQNDAFNAFIANNQNKNLSDLKANVELKLVAPNYDRFGSLTITARIDIDNKYTGQIIIPIKIIVSDQDIINTINNANITFGAIKAYNQDWNDFVHQVLEGHNPNNNPFEEHWYLKGQIRDHIADYPILNYIDYNKFQLLKFEINGHEVVDKDLKDGHKWGDIITIQVIYDYGTVKNQSIDFNIRLS